MRLESAFSSYARDIAQQSAAILAAGQRGSMQPQPLAREERGHEPITRRDSAQLSDRAISLMSALEGVQQENETGQFGSGTQQDEGSGLGSNPDLTPDEEKQVRELQARDREVRAHEQAHKAAAGELATSGPTYEYETGPDGKDYAVGGEVGIALREGDTPEESIRLAQKARKAAMAPAEPSAQDRKVAAQAAQMEQEARAEQREEEQTEASGAGGAVNDRRIAAYLEVVQGFGSVGQ